MEERVQKIMAHAGIASRRECEKLIEEGRVKVNGRTATLGQKVDAATDRIEVNGRVINAKQVDFIYIALNKPKGILSSLDDELGEGRKTVRDLIPVPGHLYPVGRLDKQSEGLMLMINDGDMAHRLTHPRYGHEKTYRVTVEGRIPSEVLDTWREGIYLDSRKTAPVEITVLRQEVTFTLLELVMREGRKRQIRRIANMLGYPVRHLVRIKIGPIDLGTMKSGEWRHLRPQEVYALRKEVANHKSGSAPASRKANLSGRKPKSQGGKSATTKPGTTTEKGRDRRSSGSKDKGRKPGREGQNKERKPGREGQNKERKPGREGQNKERKPGREGQNNERKPGHEGQNK